MLLDFVLTSHRLSKIPEGKMNGRQRILTALQIEEPDRVPVWIHAINEKSVISIARRILKNVPEYKPVNEMSPAEMMGLMNTLFGLHEILEIDGITSLDGSQLSGIRPVDKSHFYDSCGTLLERSPNGIAVVREAPIRSAKEVAGFRCPPLLPQEIFMLVSAKKRFQNQLAQFFLMRGTFVRMYRLRGMENLFIDMIENPATVHELAEKIVEYNLVLCDMVAEAGGDVFIVEDDIADKNGALISPHHFDEFVAPYNRRVVERAHQRGMKVIRHSDGNLWGTIDRLLEIGYDGLNPLEAAAAMTLLKVKEYCGDRLCLLGNIDCGNLLSNGSEQEVEAAVIQAITDAGERGGYILCSSNSIHPGIKPEIFIAMVKAAKVHGQYR